MVLEAGTDSKTSAPRTCSRTKALAATRPWLGGTANAREFLSCSAEGWQGAPLAMARDLAERLMSSTILRMCSRSEPLRGCWMKTEENCWLDHVGPLDSSAPLRRRFVDSGGGMMLRSLMYLEQRYSPPSSSDGCLGGQRNRKRCELG